MVIFGFGERLSTLRKSCNLTQKQLASKLHLAVSAISSYENNKRMPYYDGLIRIAQLFNVSTDYLLGIKPHDNLSLSELNESEVDYLTSVAYSMKETKRKAHLNKN